MLPPLFRRLWAEESPHLLTQLDLRWQVSSAMTFADHGTIGSEQALGASLKVLFGLIKLYEFERLFTGLAPEEPHRFGKRSPAPMPLADGSILAQQRRPGSGLAGSALSSSRASPSAQATSTQPA